MILSLIENTNDILHTKTEKFDFSNPSTDPIQLAIDLTETMIENGGIGLAAPQVGIPVRAFVMASNPVIAVFNPILVDSGEEEILLEEGCLSYPGLLLKVKRPKIIKVRFTRPNGEVVTEKYTGMTARIFLHELDHLDGIVFTKKSSYFHKLQAMNKVRQQR
jgi:peptide deformylase